MFNQRPEAAEYRLLSCDVRIRNKMKILNVLIFFLFVTAAFATNQIEDTVAYDGSEWTLHYVDEGDDWARPYFPLEYYLTANGLAFSSVVKSKV